MFDAITISGIQVLDQDEALDFYVNKLGFEVSAGDEGREILLEKPGPPAVDEQTAEQVRELVTKGAMGFRLGVRTSDARKTYEELRSRGVELQEEPTEQSYGIDFGLRDPFGNHIRVVQPK
jgi:uncharacterized glyoxalase superfamily protein PhnB